MTKELLEMKTGKEEKPSKLTVEKPSKLTISDLDKTNELSKHKK